MKKTILFLFISFVFFVHAEKTGFKENIPTDQMQTPFIDVTDRHLTNAGFDTEFNYDENTTGNIRGDVINEVFGWNKDMDATYTVAGTFAYGSGATFNNSAEIPETGYNGSTGGALALTTGWGVILNYSQPVTLESGKYALVSAYYNAGSDPRGSSLAGWIPEGEKEPAISTVSLFPVNTWITDTIEFVLAEETQGKIQVGLASVAGTGSGNTAKVLVDYVKIIYYGIDKTDLNNKIAEAETLYGEGKGTEADILLSAIDKAKEIANKPNATMQEIIQVVNELKEAIFNYQLKNATAANPLEVTFYIQNPSFETDGLAHWINNGMQSQTNDAPSSQGWQKEGNVYAEKWTSSSDNNKLEDASLSQELAELLSGKYRLTVSAHSTHQSGTPAVTEGTFVYAGIDETLVTEGNEYSVETIVIDGKLEIGFKTVNTTANWVGFDGFRLYYLGESVEIYNELLERKTAMAVADTLVTEGPGYFNILRYREAINAAKQVEQTKEAVLQAIRNLDDALTEAATIREIYRPLKEAIEALKKELSTTNYPDKAGIENIIKTAQAIYDSPEDQRDNIESTIAGLKEQNEIISRYNYLTTELQNAIRLAYSSDYPNKIVFEAAIETAKAVYDNPIGKDVLKTIQELTAAVTAYLNGRPSNWVTIKNGAMGKDDNGNPVQAHGAGFVQVGDTWYMIGEDRSNQWNPDVNMYSTKDFVNWKFERKIIENGVTHPQLGSTRFIERPKIMHNKKTGKYVVWCHWEQSNYGASEAAVFYCDSVNGPYKFHWAGRPLGIKSRDCTVFVDNDRTAYFISTTSENQHLGLFKLSDDYLSVVEHTELFSGQQREAPAVVRIGDTYFMLFSACTGWDPNQTSYSYSHSLTEGWSNRINIGNPIAYDTQAASILTLQGSAGTTYMYVGDRWQDPGLPESKTILFPLHFNENEKTVIYNYKQQFDLDLATGTYRDTNTEHHRLSKNNWKIHSVSSEETSSEDGNAKNAIDGDVTTKWHTQYSEGTTGAPHYIEVDMGEIQEISGFLATPRLDNSTNGTVREFLFSVSTDNKVWETVSGGTWLPYAAEVYFKPVSARYFRMTALAGTHACIAELDILTNTEDYEIADIIPYYQTGTKDTWLTSDDITVAEGNKLVFGPSLSSSGTWAFSGPNNQMSGSREYEIPHITQADSGIYTSVFLNTYNQSARKEYKVTVTPHSTAVENINSNQKEEVKRIYYNLHGMEITCPKRNNIYIVKKLFKDGSSITEKVIYY